MRFPDHFVRIGLFFLLFFTPLVFGAVHPWAYSVAEAVVALLVLFWAVRLWSQRKASRGLARHRAWPHVLPLCLFIAYVLFQLVPLPPAVLQALSPATYEIYTKALPGWPERLPYAELFDVLEAESSAPEAEAEPGVRAEAGTPGGPQTAEGAADTAFPDSGARAAAPLSSELRPDGAGHPLRLPLSLAPALTWSDLLKFIACALVFLLVLYYPAPGAARDPGRRAAYEIDFVRPFLYAILIAAFVVAALGFLNLFTWNGKVLWFFVPHDQGGGGGGVRAVGPFVAPASFANYLALTWPLMLVAALAPSFLVPRGFGAGFRVLCGFGAFIMACGVLLSLSRAGWAATALGAGILVLLLAVRRGAGSLFARTPLRRAALLTCGALGLFIFLVVAFIGPRGQEQLDRRLEETSIEEGSLQDRLAVWRSSFEMVRDFPAFGVGLGAWPDLFPHYQDAGTKGFYREAHNDYIELLAETGLVGTVLLVSFFLVCAVTILRRAFSLDAAVFPVVAALAAGMSAMAFHEIFDFNLQIPANALLFAVLLALALRLSLHAQPEPDPEAAKAPGGWRPAARRDRAAGSSSAVPSLQSAALASAALLLFTTAFSQPMVLYPYSLRRPASLGEALAAVYRHPASAEAHAALFNTVAERQDLGWQIAELERILWLEPGRTEARDAYAARLFLGGRKQEGLYELTRSVAASPHLNEHFYLSTAVAPTLFPEEQEAVVFGFRKAIEDGYPGAVDELGAFYRRTDRLSDAIALYTEAAAEADGAAEKTEHLLRAADAAVAAQELSRAEELLAEAARLRPGDTALFAKLIEGVYAPRGDVGAAKEAVARAVRNGADALVLYTSLAELARAGGDEDAALGALNDALAAGADRDRRPGELYRSYVRLARIAAALDDDETHERLLEKAIALQPNSYGALMEVARIHAARKEHNKAAFYYARATRANPGSAAAYGALARTKEAQFRFAEAEWAYANALRLAPDNEALRKRYEAFQARVERANASAP